MKPENLKCPDCNGPMTSRLNKQKQTRFWGCKAFPSCRGTRDANGMSKQDRESCHPDYEPEDADHPGNHRFYGDN